MIASYHNHTYRCMHADGTEKEYIEEAIEGGFKIFGFSDHTPYPFPEEYESNFRMKISDFDDYCDTILDLKKEYAKDIEIHIGLEAEYYPRHFDALLELIHDYPIEYLILGQHVLNNEYDGVPSGAPTDNESTLKAYVDQVIEGINTGKFIYVAHPDVFNFIGDKAVYQKEMQRLVDAANSKNLPLEINLLGIEERRNYPTDALWEIIGKTDARVIFGADAHHLGNIYRPDAIEEAMQIVKKYNLNYIDVLDGADFPKLY